METSSSSSSATTLALAATAAVALVAIPVLYRKSDESNKYPPGPPGHLLFGNAPDMPDPAKGEGLPEEQFLNWSKEYGLVYTISVPLIGKLIIIADPEFAKNTLVKRNYPKSPFYKQLTPVIGNTSMAAIGGKEWASMRRAFNQGFTPSFLKTMVSTMVEKLERFTDCINEDIAQGQATNMLSRAQTFTSDVIVSIAFGTDWGGKTIHPARQWNDEICKLLGSVMFDPMRRMFAWSAKRDLRRYEQLITDEMMNILEARLEDDEKNSEAKDICSIAIQHIRGENGELTKQDKDNIVSQLKTFYFAGHDTTATTIAWALWNLSQCPTILEKLRAELVEQNVWVTPETPAPDYDQLSKCEYLEAIVKETLRLYPPATTVSRLPADPNETYNGYRVGGAIHFVSPYVMHRHPDLWKQPEAFRPERFLDGSEDNLQSKYMPFSRGPRDCIGKYFAYLEAKLALAALVMRYDLNCVDPMEKMIPQLTAIPKNGAQVKFQKRGEVSK